MKALEEKIAKDGKILPGNVLKVNHFLNHQIDVDFLMEIGKEIATLFKDERINKILTIEASGIAIAVAAASYMHVPVVFAKKNSTSNLGSDTYVTTVTSYTHKKVYNVVVSKEFLHSDDRVLLVDDFLAYGNALFGLIDLVNQAGGTTVGVSAVIEKGYQGGGDKLRAAGLRVESLARIASMDEKTGVKFY